MPGIEIKGRSKIATYRHGGRVGAQEGKYITKKSKYITKKTQTPNNPKLKGGYDPTKQQDPKTWGKLKKPKAWITKKDRSTQGKDIPTMAAKGGRIGLAWGDQITGKKGTFEKVGEAISRKWRGKEKTKVKGIEQDVKTGALTHKAPKDRLDTQAGRAFRNKVRGWKTGYPRPTLHSSNDMSYKARKKEIAKEKKEAERKKAFDKKHGVE
jgi:hypothetical protein